VLSCNEETVKKLSDGIDEASERFQHDGKAHNFSMSVGSAPVTGVIVHCNLDTIGKRGVIFGLIVKSASIFTEPRNGMAFV
jgi:hypothetical protein